jgi:hypothetical protein
MSASITEIRVDCGGEPAVIGNRVSIAMHALQLGINTSSIISASMGTTTPQAIAKGNVLQPGSVARYTIR